MTESERVAERLIEYRNNPPLRDCGAFEGRFYQTGDIMAIIMDPVAEFDGHEYITRLVALILGPKSDESEELASSVWASRAERLGVRLYRAEKYAAETELENDKLRELLSMYVSFAQRVARGSTVHNSYPECPGKRMNETEMRERALELGVKGCM